jgi:hypothetical protein
MGQRGRAVARDLRVLVEAVDGARGLGGRITRRGCDLITNNVADLRRSSLDAIHEPP